MKGGRGGGKEIGEKGSARTLGRQNWGPGVPMGMLLEKCKGHFVFRAEQVGRVDRETEVRWSWGWAQCLYIVNSFPKYTPLACVPGTMLDPIKFSELWQSQPML